MERLRLTLRLRLGPLKAALDPTGRKQWSDVGVTDKVSVICRWTYWAAGSEALNVIGQHSPMMIGCNERD